MQKYAWDVYAPFGVGLDTVFHRLDSMTGHNTNYPPYNIIKHDNSNYEVEIALAGFKAEEIEVTTESNILRVASRHEKANTNISYVHKGLSKRAFNNSWQLADDVRVTDVQYSDGLLSISLEKIIPEHQKRVTYTIGEAKTSDKQLLTE
jgi:molecular chaperone IbpA